MNYKMDFICLDEKLYEREKILRKTIVELFFLMVCETKSF